MTDFLFTELARDRQRRLTKQAADTALVRAAQYGTTHGRRGPRRWLRARHDRPGAGAR